MTHSVRSIEEVGRAALYINGIPVITAVTGWLVLGERLTPLQWIGGALVLVSVRLSGRKAAETVPPEAYVRDIGWLPPDRPSWR